MSEQPIFIDDTINQLLEIDGVRSASIDLEITLTVDKRATGEVDDNFQEVREREVGPEQIRAVLGDGWSYTPNVDMMYDFRVDDWIGISTKIEANDD